MRGRLAFLALGMALVVASAAGAAEAPKLAFYVVSETPVAGGRYVDTAAFPHAGYLSAAPDLQLHKLVKVEPDAMWASFRGETAQVRAAMQARGMRPGLSITLLPEDAAGLTALTKRAIGKQVLLLLDGEPILLAVIQTAIDSESFLITTQTEAEAERYLASLERLAK